MAVIPKQVSLTAGDTQGVSRQLIHADGSPVLLAEVDTIVLTLKKGSTVINLRNGQNVKNTNNCTFHATSGWFHWDIQQEDTELVSATAKKETHIATVVATLLDGQEKTQIINIECLRRPNT